MELVLSNTTTFFSGRLEPVFKKARHHGFRYLELVPYRWTKPSQILQLEHKYGVQVAGIHLPPWWRRPRQFDVFTPLWWFYLGPGETSPALALARALHRRRPYLLLHSNLPGEMGKTNFAKVKKEFNVVVENIPHNSIPAKVPLAFDPSHYGRPLTSPLPTRPKVVHIGYDHFPFLHGLPNKPEQEELKKIIARYQPRYLVLETSPWVSVAKGKELLENILSLRTAPTIPVIARPQAVAIPLEEGLLRHPPKADSSQ